ncbi:anillin-like isoform X2 [Orussus abietinus]|nr:anillin-like isoform X2 [Orussus abietinus]
MQDAKEDLRRKSTSSVRDSILKTQSTKDCLNRKSTSLIQDTYLHKTKHTTTGNLKETDEYVPCDNYKEMYRKPSDIDIARKKYLANNFGEITHKTSESINADAIPLQSSSHNKNKEKTKHDSDRSSSHYETLTTGYPNYRQKYSSYLQPNDKSLFVQDNNQSDNTYVTIENKDIKNVLLTSSERSGGVVNNVTSSTYIKDFRLGNIKWRGPLCNAASTLSDKTNLDSSINHSSAVDIIKKPETCKVQHNDINPDLKADLIDIDQLKQLNDVQHNHKTWSKDLKDSAGEVQTEKTYESRETVCSDSLLTSSISEEIKDLDADIKRLEISSSKLPMIRKDYIKSPFEKIYPDFTNILTSTSDYTTKTLEQPYTPLKHSNCKSLTPSSQRIIKEVHIKNSAEKPHPDSNFKQISTTSSPKLLPKIKQPASPIVLNDIPLAGKYHFQTPKTGRSKPNLESTRKSLNMNVPEKPSPQIETSISTITVPNSPESPKNDESSGQQNSSTDLNNTTPYAVKQFLTDALGDELNNTTVTYGPLNAHGNITHDNVSEFFSESSSPHVTNTEENKTMRETFSQARASLNRTLTLYRSFTKRIRKTFRSDIKALPKSTSQLLAYPNFNEDERINCLWQELDIQQEQLNQGEKALNQCRFNKDFIRQVQLERIFLVINLKKRTIFEEIKRVSSDEKNSKPSSERGKVTIGEININLQKEQSNDIEFDGIRLWFIAVISHGLTILATQTVEYSRNDYTIHLPGTFSIPNLTTDFKITVHIYCLEYKDTDSNGSQSSKKLHACPSPKKLLKCAEKSVSRLQNKQSQGVRRSLFMPCGFVELGLHDLALSSPWPLSGVPRNSILQGTIDLSLTCELDLTITHSGFLTHGDEAGGLAVWNRRWCVLQGHSLMFWNYPPDEETKSPLLTIDLKHCISDKITIAERTICAKPRTLLIETARRRDASDRNSMMMECRSSLTIVRNLLSCDDTNDLMKWMTKFNHVISALREWSVSLQPQQEISEL